MPHLEREKEGKVEIINMSVRTGRREKEGGRRKTWPVLMHVRVASAAEQGQKAAESV